MFFFQKSYANRAVHCQPEKVGGAVDEILLDFFYPFSLTGFIFLHDFLILLEAKLQ